MTFLDMIPPAWMRDARCSSIGGDAFFPDRGGDARPARRICGACDVRAKCLSWVLDIEIAEQSTMPGIYGGATGQERRAIRLGERAA